MGRRPDPPAERGIIEEAHRNAMYTVRLPDARTVIATLSGKLRAHYVRLGVGDAVLLECSPYDRARGRIVRRDPGQGEEPGALQRVLR